MENLFGRFEFFGFEPSNETHTTAKEILGHVCGDSPSDANSVVQLTKTQRGFEGLLKVTSLAGTFLAHVVEADPVRAMQKLHEKMCEQLTNWKEKRDITGTLAAV
jgi:hypothetical protein